MLRGNIVYKYSCPQCNAGYVGETTRHLYTRISEHRGLSPRTLKFLSKDPNSRIFDHYLDSGHEISENIFEIVTSCNFDLKTVESIAIKLLKPSLNTHNSSISLDIL